MGLSEGFLIGAVLSAIVVGDHPVLQQINQKT
jgi:hypothetical protein